MKQAMIFAAGMGTRLKPLTDFMPKALVEVGGRPLLYHIVMKLKAAGFERIVVNVHHFADMIERYVEENDSFGMDIRFSDECDNLLDTGGGIRKALPLFDAGSPILIHNVDILSNVDLSAFYEMSNNNDATLLVSRRKTKRYLLFDDRMSLRGWTNVETGEVKMSKEYAAVDAGDLSMLAFSGIHVINPSALSSCLDEMPERFGVIDFYLKWCGKHDFKGFVKEDLNLLDVGKLDTVDRADRFLSDLYSIKNIN